MQPTLDVSRPAQSRKRPPSPLQTPGQLSPTGRPQNTHLVWLFPACVNSPFKAKSSPGFLSYQEANASPTTPQDWNLTPPGLTVYKLYSLVFLWPPAVQQLEFLKDRKKQYLKAALQAKQKNDIEQAKALLLTAKSLDPIIEGARSGGAVDISSVSVHGNLFFIAGNCRGSHLKRSVRFSGTVRQTDGVVAAGAVPSRRRRRGLHPGASQRRADVGQSPASLHTADEDPRGAVRGAPLRSLVFHPAFITTSST